MCTEVLYQVSVTYCFWHVSLSDKTKNVCCLQKRFTQPSREQRRLCSYTRGRKESKLVEHPKKSLWQTNQHRVSQQKIRYPADSNHWRSRKLRDKYNNWRQTSDKRLRIWWKYCFNQVILLGSNLASFIWKVTSKVSFSQITVFMK